MKIIIGSDHRGFVLKEYLKKTFKSQVEFTDVGCDTEERCDYPQYAYTVVQTMKAKPNSYGVLICGSGIGMVIAANRSPGIYAGLCWNSQIAKIAYAHDRINVLALPSDYVSKTEAAAIFSQLISDWEKPLIQNDRYAERLRIIDVLFKI